MKDGRILNEAELEAVVGGLKKEPGDYCFVKGVEVCLPVRSGPYAGNNIVYKLRNDDCVKFIKKAENGYVLVDLVDGSQPAYVLAEYLE